MDHLNGIKNIIFDLGNVIIDINHEIAIKRFKELHPETIISLNDPLFEQYEKGELSTQTFLKKLATYFPNASEDELIEAWNSLLLEMPLERLKIVRTLKQKGYMTFLLSNTNELHYRNIIERLKNYHPRYHFKNIFDDIFLSYMLHLRKPQPEIFQIILDKYNLISNETLFIDDINEHLETANKLGIRTMLVTPGNHLKEIFKVVLCK